MACSGTSEHAMLDMLDAVGSLVPNAIARYVYGSALYLHVLRKTTLLSLN
jgi:hypothetical protein